MVVPESGINSKLSNERARGSPREDTRECEQENGNRDMPRREWSQPEMSLPQEGERKKLKEYAPAGAPVHDACWRRVVVCGDERVKPRDNTNKQQKVGVYRHEGNAEKAQQSQLLKESQAAVR
jgi:hypothetical protein